MSHHYLSLSPWWAINCLARVPGEDREVNITEFFGLVHHWQQKVNRCSGIEHNAGTTWRNSSLAKPHSISGIEARTTFRWQFKDNQKSSNWLLFKWFVFPLGSPEWHTKSIPGPLEEKLVLPTLFTKDCWINILWLRKGAFRVIWLNAALFDENIVVMKFSPLVLAPCSPRPYCGTASDA